MNTKQSVAPCGDPSKLQSNFRGRAPGLLRIPRGNSTRGLCALRFKNLSLIKVMVLIGILFAACQSSSDIPSALIKLPNAMNVNYQKSNGIAQLTYNLQEQYPARDVIYKISKQLGKNGWQPLAKDYLNPRLPSSHIQGWTDFIDAAKRPPEKVHQWLAQWNDSEGNIVGYLFRYAYPENETPNLSDLNVYAYYVPVTLAGKQLEGIPQPAPQ